MGRRSVPSALSIPPARHNRGPAEVRDAHRRTRSPFRPRPAAGILCRFTDAEGVWYLLGKRHRRLGGTWANIGGSLHAGEAAFAGAVREFGEELSIDAERLGATIAGVIECGTRRVPYTLFILDVPCCFDDAQLSWENDALYGWHAAEVGRLPLHKVFPQRDPKGVGAEVGAKR